MADLKKTVLVKSSFREITQSKTRFLSIMGIIFLGVMVFVGLKATGPDMTQTATNYFQQEKLPDARVVSSLGLTTADVDDLQKNTSVASVYPRYTKDIQISEKNLAVKFIGYDDTAKDRLGDFKVVKGRMPQKSGEVALDSLVESSDGYKIGDTIHLSAEDNTDTTLKKDALKVVGFVQSPEYLENTSRGNTTVGKGTLDFFAVVPVEDIQLSTYTEILVSFKGLSKLNGYSDSYQTKRDADIKTIKKSLKNRPTERVEEIKQAAQKELTDAQAKITANEEALVKTEQQLKTAQQQITEGTQTLNEAKQSVKAQLAAAENELAQKQTLLTENQTSLQQQQATVTAKKNELDQAANQMTQAQQSVTTLQQQRTTVSAASQTVTAAETGYQGLASSLALLDRVPEELLPQSLANGASQLQAAVQGLGSPVQLETAITQLINQPSKAAIAEAMGVINRALTELNQQQAQLVSQLQTIDQGLATLNQTISAYTEGQQQIASAQQQLDDAQAQLTEANAQLALGQQEFSQKKAAAEAELTTQQVQLTKAQQEYNQGNAEFSQKKADAVPQLAKAKQELATKKQELAELKIADYYYFNRDDNPGYSEYGDNANRISSLSTVFPLFFFLIAALVSLTTMTRMVEEKRMEIGSLKAMGYKNSEIAFKFLVYASIASLSGAVLGLVVGYYLFPTIIFDAYGQLYNIPNFVTPWYLSYSVTGLLVAVLCTAGAAMIVLRIDLFSTPASLLRPKAPKAGQRILLERIKPIWARLSFIQKVTARNLFRYKQRMLMTVLGIAGCMALIITGFGLKDSISDIVNIQFDKLWHYQAAVTLKDTNSTEEIKAYEQSLAKMDNIKDFMPLHVEQLETTKAGNAKQEVSIYVPEETKKISDFVLFNDRKTGKVYQLTDDGVIINEKLATLFDYKVGDTLELKNDENQTYKLKIQAIAENYTGHFAYMSPSYYEKIVGKAPVYDTEFLLFKQTLNKKQENTISRSLMSDTRVLNVTFLSASSDSLDDTIRSLNIVVWVLIIVSGLLAFIVLYNLTNINISERIRELSTIKVLGFYDNEVTMYVYRENIILTCIGVFFGCFLGKIVHGYVLKTVEVDMLMFSPTIHWLSYLYSSLLTFFFALLVMVIMHRKLKKVDMIEALKSND